MNGPPQKPTTACSGASSRRTMPIASRIGATDSAGSGTRSRSTRRLRPDRLGNDRADALDELDVDTHRDDRGHDVGEHHGGVHVVPPDGLKRHLGGELGRPVDLEEGVLRADLAVLRQRPPRLPHEPDRRPLGRLAPRGAHEERFHRPRLAAQ